VKISTPDGTTVAADSLGIAPRVDPRLQGATFFYLAPGGKLSAGMNVTARFAGTQAMSGAIVPSDSVVSFQGKSWVYIKRDPTHFVRREVSIRNPAGGGFFVTNVPAGSEVVTNGAQQLLSEEMRSQLHEE
jgi:multidrug efflux pump subunit AcrA (membrane-fusion protein)